MCLQESKYIQFYKSIPFVKTVRVFAGATKHSVHARAASPVRAAAGLQQEVRRPLEARRHPQGGLLLPVRSHRQSAGTSQQHR